MSEQGTQQQPAPDEGPQEGKQERQQQGGARERTGRRRRHGQHGGGGQPSSSPSRRPDPSLNMDELRDLVQLIAEHGFTDFELEREGFRVRLKRELTPQVVAVQAQPATQAPLVVQAPVTQEAASPASTSSTPSAAATTHAQPKHPGAEAEAAASADEDLHIITSPIVGTFYRTPSPTAEPFVRIGSHVDADTVVCIIEAMKLMNEIQAETSGEVAKIYVENGQPVEFGQPLFGIKQ